MFLLACLFTSMWLVGYGNEGWIIMSTLGIGAIGETIIQTVKR